MSEEVKEVKKLSLKDIATKFNKEYKNNNMIVKSDIIPEYTKMPSGALGMDYPLFGGLPLGRICVFSGLQHSGKTTAACVQLAAFQKEFPDKTCVYVDIEHSLDLKFQAKMTGMNLSNLYYVSPNGLSGEQILDMIVEFEKADDIGLIVLDSLPALLPQIVLENDLEKDAGMRASIAKKLYPFCAMMCDMINVKNNILILINQVRDDGKTFTGIQKYKEPCGTAPQFYSSVSIRFGTRKFTLEDNMDACGAQNGEGADGYRLSFKILKNKCSPCNRGGGFITFRYDTGMDVAHDLLEIALDFDFIKRLNNVTYQLIDLATGEIYQDENGQLLQGKKNELIDYIMTHDDFKDKYLKMLQTYISGGDKSYGSLLSEEMSKEIDAQEAAITIEN